MPKRPPKKWWYDCVKGVEESGAAYSPESVCGDLWHHKMTKSQRARIVSKEMTARKRRKAKRKRRAKRR